MCWTNRPCFDTIKNWGGAIFRTPLLDGCTDYN